MKIQIRYAVIEWVIPTLFTVLAVVQILLGQQTQRGLRYVALSFISTLIAWVAITMGIHFLHFFTSPVRKSFPWGILARTLVKGSMLMASIIGVTMLLLAISDTSW